MDCFSVYVTAADREQARLLARTAVEERLAACANILGEIESLYHWEGRLQQDREVALLLKTTATCLPRLLERLRQLHSYQIPGMVVWPIVGGHKPYLQWLEQQCRAPDAPI